MDNVTITKMLDLIIVEKSIGQTILKGSNLFCGCCGETLGTLKENITFPFDSNNLIPLLEDVSFKHMFYGLKHETCGHIIFPFKKDWEFVQLDIYLERYQNKTTNG